MEQIEGNVILVIDDDEINLSMAKMILEAKLPCRVITCNNGIQGIEILKRQYVKLLLLDVMMPHVDGIQTLEKIRSEPKLKNLPVIMLTASTEKKHITKAIQLGVKDYVRKPFMPDELIKRVGERLGPITTESKQRLLLIDEDVANRNKVKELIESNLPHEVIEANGGIEGMEVLRKQKVQIVVASCDMRLINGNRIIEFMLKDAELRKIPCFLMASNIEMASDASAGVIQLPVTDKLGLAPIINYLKGNK